MLVATAPLVIAKDDEGHDVYVYRGGRIPEGQDENWVTQMLEEGLVAKGDAAGALKPPAKNASRDEWLTFALASGADEDEVADLTRDELRDLYK